MRALDDTTQEEDPSGQVSSLPRIHEEILEMVSRIFCKLTQILPHEADQPIHAIIKVQEGYT